MSSLANKNTGIAPTSFDPFQGFPFFFVQKLILAKTRSQRFSSKEGLEKIEITNSSLLFKRTATYRFSSTKKSHDHRSGNLQRLKLYDRPLSLEEVQHLPSRLKSLSCGDLMVSVETSAAGAWERRGRIAEEEKKGPFFKSGSGFESLWCEGCIDWPRLAEIPRGS